MTYVFCMVLGSGHRICDYVIRRRTIGVELVYTD